MKLYAICWRDTYEPWGWAPAQGNEGDPPQAFSWDRGEAEGAFAALVEREAADALERLRERDRDRVQQDQERYEREVARGRPGIGVYVSYAGATAPEWKPTPPARAVADAKLETWARAEVESEWSIQEYDVPEPRGSK